MKFKLVERGNPARRDLPKKWHPNAVNAGKFTLKDLAKEIAGRSSLTKGDVENVLSNFIEELPTFLKMGMSVQLGDFGTLRLTLSGEGADTAADFNTSTISARVVFTPGVELKNALSNIKFEQTE